VVWCSHRFVSTASGQFGESTIAYAPMRVAPVTITQGTGGSYGNAGSGTVGIFTPQINYARFAVQSTAAGDCYGLNVPFALSAEL
jgi:hypothetical protein